MLWQHPQGVSWPAQSLNVADAGEASVFAPFAKRRLQTLAVTRVLHGRTKRCGAHSGNVSVRAEDYVVGGAWFLLLAVPNLITRRAMYCPGTGQWLRWVAGADDHRKTAFCKTSLQSRPRQSAPAESKTKKTESNKAKKTNRNDSSLWPRETVVCRRGGRRLASDSRVASRQW